jgi:transposase
MAGRSIEVVDIREIIRHIRMKKSIRKTAEALEVNPRTVSKYSSWARQQGLLKGALPDLEAIEKLLAESGMTGAVEKQASKAAPYHDKIEEFLSTSCSSQVIFERLRGNYGFDGSYDSVNRYVLKLKKKQPDAYVRIEVEPGEESQVDFGSAGWMFDPVTKRLRKAWCFVMVLSHSRHMFVKFVFDQKIATWLRLHRDAFEYFDGVAKKVVLDNLKAAIVKAVLYDPVLQRTYLECAEHYGFLVSPCRVKTPRHKGKVECGGVKFVKKNFMPCRSFIDIEDANRQVAIWSVEKGKRIHGTTKRIPLEVFEKIEKQALLPLPEIPYDISWWKECKLHPDCHIVLNGSYYSAPHRLVGETLQVRVSDEFVRIFHQHQQIGMHLKAGRKGQRLTVPEHMPPEKMRYLMRTPIWCKQKAKETGENTLLLVERLLAERPLDKLRTVQGILGLGRKYGSQRLEAACKRALFYDDIKYGTIRNILERELDKQPLQTESIRQYFSNGKFARYTIGGLFNDKPTDTAT